MTSRAAGLLPLLIVLASEFLYISYAWPFISSFHKRVQRSDIVYASEMSVERLHSTERPNVNLKMLKV